MKDVGQRTAEAAALKHAVPYIRIFKGKTFVLKAGGGALEREATARDLVEQIEVLHQVGIRVVLVHGGGTQSSDLARALGAETRFVEGRRVTDAKALEVAAMVLNGAVNTQPPRRLPERRPAGGGGLRGRRRPDPGPQAPAGAGGRRDGRLRLRGGRRGRRSQGADRR